MGSPANMVDGNIDTDADTISYGDVELLDGNTCDGIDLEYITKVELRAYGKTVEIGKVSLRPIFGGGDGDTHNSGIGNVEGWGDYIDITNDTNAPVAWSWANVQDLDCDVIGLPAGSLAVYVSKVEIRVTYCWSSSSSSSCSSCSCSSSSCSSSCSSSFSSSCSCSCSSSSSSCSCSSSFSFSSSSSCSSSCSSSFSSSSSCSCSSSCFSCSCSCSSSSYSCSSCSCSSSLCSSSSNSSSCSCSSSFSSSSSCSCSCSSSFSSSSSSCSADVTKDYTRGDYNILPADDTNLETAFVCTDYIKVTTDDNVYVQQCATDEYVVFLFKQQGAESSSVIIISWKGKSDRAPSDSIISLQIYNRDTTAWETLDTDNATAANVEFTLEGIQSINLADYYDGGNWVACRIYQEAS